MCCHHLTLIWISSAFRCNPKPGDGTAKSQDEQCAEDTEKSLALSATEYMFKIWNLLMLNDLIRECPGSRYSYYVWLIVIPCVCIGLQYTN